MHVTVLQADRRLFDGAAAQVVLPGADGELSVFDHHAPMLCALGAGLVQVDDRPFRIREGLACLARNQLTILTRP